MPPSPLRVPRCRDSKSAGRIASSRNPPRSYIRSAEECSSDAAMTHHHARDPQCSIAKDAACRLLDDCVAGARGRAAACPRNAAHMMAAYSGCYMLMGTTGHTSYPRMCGSVVTSTNTIGAGGMSPGEHLYARRTRPTNLRWSRRTPQQADPLDCCRTSLSAVITIQSGPP